MRVRRSQRSMASKAYERLAGATEQVRATDGQRDRSYLASSREELESVEVFARILFLLLRRRRYHRVSSVGAAEGADCARRTRRSLADGRAESQRATYLISRSIKPSEEVQVEPWSSWMEMFGRLGDVGCNF